MSSSAPDRPGEKLHAFSWLFVVIAQLVNLLPLLVTVLVAGSMSSRDGWESGAAVIGALGLSAYALFYTFTFRFWVEPDEIVVKEGLFDRTLRHVPFTRIQNVAFRQNPLHRVFGVVELNLESGAGQKPEAKLTVLPMARAKLLQLQIRQLRAANVSADPAGAEATPETDEALLHAVPLTDLLRLGLISNRGMVLIGASFYFLGQSNIVPKGFIKQIGRYVRDQFGLVHGPLFWLLSAVFWILLIMLVARVASMLMAIYTYSGFKLFADDGRLRVEHGLLTRQGGSTKADRIVCFLLRDGWRYRLFKRQSAEVVLPVNLQEQNGAGASGMRYLSPMAKPEVAEVLIQQASGVALSAVSWQPLHPAAWRRGIKWPLGILSALLALALGWLIPRFGADAGFGSFMAYLLLSAWVVYSARRDAQASGFALISAELLIRTGYFSQITHVLPLREIQSVSLSQSPFDRQSQMANVHVDLRAGSALQVPEAVVHFLPTEVALGLATQLRQAALVQQLS